MGTLIGTGNSGFVYKFHMEQFGCDVALKVSKSGLKASSNTAKSIISEIKIMSSIASHDNILALLGVCVEESLFLVMEYCEHGPLVSYLCTNERNKSHLSGYELLKFCIQVAKGLQHLHESNIIHGDMAARNVLLNSSMDCKICDFGLSRKVARYELYMKTGEEPLPWQWMAPESLEKLEFSTQSDIWSLGVTFWEIFTLGRVPFAGMSWNKFFQKELVRGLRLEQPALCGDNMYALMLKCWKLEQKDRPNAGNIFANLDELRRIEYTIL